MRLQHSPIKSAAMELGLPVETPVKSRAPEFVAQLRALEADALIVAAYGQILSTAVLESATRGGINLHGSILPKYRGAAPIQRAVLNGDSETGVTLMQMDRGMDTGDIIEIRRTQIDPDESYGELQNRLSIIAADQIHGWIDRIVGGNYPRTPQPEGATHAAKIEKAEAELSFDRPSEAEYNRFRAFTPSPGAYFDIEGKRFRVARMATAEGQSGEPGTIVSVQPELVVAFQEGALAILEWQPEGKKRMSGRDYANGARLRPGMRLT
ncbi:methionyl-tRNA formyltransferase [soil metagenome]